MKDLGTDEIDSDEDFGFDGTVEFEDMPIDTGITLEDEFEAPRGPAKIEKLEQEQRERALQEQQRRQRDPAFDHAVRRHPVQVLLREQQRQPDLAFALADR